MPQLGGGQAEDHVGPGRHRALAPDGQEVVVDAESHRDRQLRGHHLSGGVSQSKYPMGSIFLD